MKKYIIFILSIICLTFTKVNATNVRITNIELDSKSEEAVINNEATFADLQINTDIKFFMLNDYVKYKITITNEDNEDYSIDLKNNNLSEYLEYSYENANTIKANSTTTIYMTIKYIKLVEDAKYTDYKYNETNAEIITLKNSKNEVVTATVENPYTGNKVLIIAIVIAVGSLLTIILLKHKLAFRYSLIIITTAIISIPILCNALSNLTLTLNSKVEFDYNNNIFCIEYLDNTPEYLEFKYREGTTYIDYIENNLNHYYPTRANFLDGANYKDVKLIENSDEFFDFYNKHFNISEDDSSYSYGNVAEEDEILSKEKGCYFTWKQY